tara:strand:- start:1466 stop:2071 length:606 start_codon:yes stop_codon:yes gene_type:complete
MYSRKVLEVLTAKMLKEICTDYGLATSGKKAVLVERIIEHQDKLENLRQNWEARMSYGVAKRDEGFERVIQVFQQWTDENGFWPSKLAKSGVSYEFVDINEIRAAFADYDPDTSTLREDKYVPCPGTKLEVFLEMLFNERDDWEICDTTTQEREFDCDSEFNDRWMVEGMKKIYDETAAASAAAKLATASQWCATSYANRD